MALLSLFIFGLITLFSPISYNKRAYAIAMIIMFSIFIVYDTHYLLIRNKDHNVIAGAIDYYLDIVNIALQISIWMYAS